jgi:hypothetical protein
MRKGVLDGGVCYKSANTDMAWAAFNLAWRYGRAMIAGGDYSFNLWVYASLHGL